MKMGKRSLAEGGFTLIELMTVVVVLAVLAVIAVPAYQEQVRKSRRGQAQAHLVELAQNAERFHTINNTYVGFWDTVPTSSRQSPRDGAAQYNLSFVNPGRNESERANRFSLTAAPTGGQLKDKCGALSLSQTGQKWHSTGTSNECRFGTQGTAPS